LQREVQAAASRRSSVLQPADEAFRPELDAQASLPNLFAPM
jgi:hypothetical protein